MLAMTASVPTACEHDSSACSNGHAEPARIIPELSASKLRKDYTSSFIQNVLWLTGTFPFRRSHTTSQSLLAASPVFRNRDGKAARNGIFL